MPRHPRKMSKSNIYHVMMRGNGRRNIFEDDEDKLKFIDTIYEKNKKENYSLYAYCIMDNHVHLVIENKKEILSKIMKSINTTYANYYNRKYRRIGHVFQDRFKSEEIEDERYLLAAVRYVHNNPIKANMVKSMNEYKWSSYREYIQGNKKCIDIDYMLNIFSEDKKLALQKFIKFSEQIATEKFIDLEEIYYTKMCDSEAYKYINNYLCTFGFGIMNLTSQKKNEVREQIIRELKMNRELSIRQIAKVLGINKGMVERAKM